MSEARLLELVKRLKLSHRSKVYLEIKGRKQSKKFSQKGRFNIL